jgi:hypothetical protein
VTTRMTMSRKSRMAAVLTALAASGIGMAACGGSSSPHASSSSTTTIKADRASQSAINEPLVVHFGTGTVGPADTTTSIPTERGNAIPAVLAAGQNIIITAKGCDPQTLEANVSAPVVWTNLSGHPQRVIFKNFPVDSGTIPVGGTFTWSTNNAVAMAYTLAPSGWVGKLDMNPVNP